MVESLIHWNGSFIFCHFIQKTLMVINYTLNQPIFVLKLSNMFISTCATRKYHQIPTLFTKIIIHFNKMWKVSKWKCAKIMENDSSWKSTCANVSYIHTKDKFIITLVVNYKYQWMILYKWNKKIQLKRPSVLGESLIHKN